MSNVAAFTLPSRRRRKAPACPRKFGKRARAFWRGVQKEYGIEDTAGLELLRQAAEFLDRAEEARAHVAEFGLLVADRDGAMRTNPAWRIERDARAAFLATLKSMALDVAPLRPAAGRPAGR